MLTIRLSRVWRTKLPLFRIVVTEHTKPVKAWYIDVVGQYDPVKHLFNANTDKIAWYLKNGSQMSERVAKLLYAQTQDAVYQKFFKYQERSATTKNPNKYD